MAIIRISAGHQPQILDRSLTEPDRSVNTRISSVQREPSEHGRTALPVIAGQFGENCLATAHPVITRVPSARSGQKLKVAAYCRVSTKQEEQEESLETQQETYTKQIYNHSDWEFAGIYADKVSGISADKRTDFMRMIGDAMDGKIDRILCKSVSRFSRNVVECKKFVDMLRTRNVAVEFEKENIRTDDPTTFFYFSLMSAVAENESLSISENIRWSNMERVKRGEYTARCILGYDCVDGKLVPNKDADNVRLIYAMYLEGYRITEIRQYLFDAGVKSKTGNPISCSAIHYLLQNEAYKGDKLLQKNPPKNLFTKRPDPNLPYVSNYLVDEHEAIVEKSVWDAVQQRIADFRKQQEVVGHRGGQPHFLYGKVFCACGAPMTRRTVSGAGGEKCKIWACREQRTKGFTCKNRKIKEESLLAAISAKMGWKQFDKDKFGKTVERVIIKADGLEVIQPRYNC